MKINFQQLVFSGKFGTTLDDLKAELDIGLFWEIVNRIL